MWYAIVTPIITAILVSIFSSEMNMYWKVLSGIITFIFIYIVGLVDEKLKLLNREQNEYAKRNPYLVEMDKKLDEINNKLNESISNNDSLQSSGNTTKSD
ncbi:MAG: hypothetical protein OEY89_01385 [Gammaproteobacteria bacterium]|nr:hypothetical protein [Gammaproteobacteria bacterium]